MNPVQLSFEKRRKSEEGLFGSIYGKRLSFLISYPNYYNLGMANLGFQTIYKILLQDERLLVDRAFLPYSYEERYLKEKKLPLFSFITYTPLKEFDVIAFSISFEPDYLNFIKILQLSNIPLYAREREEEYPLIIVGGVAPSANPLPIEPFVDVFVIGEGEEVIRDIVEVLLEEKEKDSVLKIFASWEGIYVPRYPKRTKRLWVKDIDSFDAESVIYSRNQEFPDMHLIEIGRGCGRGCRFCMAGYIYRPVRNRSVNSVLDSVKRGKKYRNKVGLISPSVSDHPQIIEILKGIVNEGMKVGISSLRSDSVTKNLLMLLKKGGLNTITLAPEVGTEKMRKVINKNIYPELLFEKIDDALSTGIRNIKLYFLVGLPEEDDEDIEGIVELIKSIINEFGSMRELILSINPFIPKPHTPFEILPQERESVVNKRFSIIEKKIKKRYNKIKILPREIKYYILQGLLSRGDREVSKYLPKIVSIGPRHFKKVIPDQIIEKTIFTRLDYEYVPWRVIDTMVEIGYLKGELNRVNERRLTPPCPPRGCTLCGVCKNIGRNI